VGDDGYLHFAYDDNRHRAVYYGAKLPGYSFTCFGPQKDE
jgi:hypothetical protein